MPGRGNPAPVFCAVLRACVRAPRKRDFARFSCYFPLPPCYFRPIFRLRVDLIADLHFARPHLQGFTGTSRWRAEIIGAIIKAAKGGDVGAMRLCWDCFAPVPRNTPDAPELIVIHINFIRAMISALDRGLLVPPKEATSQGELTSARTAGKAHIAPS
jgi:hypothetical protein